MANILIIGASSGIGLTLAKKLDTDHKLTFISRTGDALQSLNGQYQKKDVLNDEESWPEIDELDSLIYLPGTINLKPFNRLKQEDFQTDLNVNLLGAIKAIQNYLPVLKKGNNASITLMSTVAVGRGMPFHASVASAKGAIEGLTRSLAAEFAPRIRVNAIAPSLVETSLADGLLNTEAKVKSSQERHPLKRIGQPEDIASAIAYLISEEASWVTGQILPVDGGLSSI